MTRIMPILLFAFSIQVSAFDEAHVKRLKVTNECPGCDLSGADLSAEAMMTSMQLEYHANLKGANLSDADLSKTPMNYCNFEGANLSGADLSWTGLSYCNFKGANLRGADLKPATKVKTDFTNADLTDTGITREYANKHFKRAILCNTKMPWGIENSGCDRKDGGEYIGKVKYGKPHGQGTETYADGSKYVGEFEDGKRHGQGIHIHTDGTKFVGEWKNGKRHGQGTFIYGAGPFGGVKYIGEWKNDTKWNGTNYDKDGKITYTYLNGLPTSAN